MTTKTLEQRAREMMHENSTLCDSCYPNGSCENDTITIDEAVPLIAKLAREHAERCVRSMYDVDDNDQWSSDGERARGSFRVKAEFCGRPHTESRRYRAEFDEMVTQILSAAEKGEP